MFSDANEVPVGLRLMDGNSGLSAEQIEQRDDVMLYNSENANRKLKLEDHISFSLNKQINIYREEFVQTDWSSGSVDGNVGISQLAMYLPQSLGFLFARLIYPSFNVMFYAGAIFQMFLYIIVMFFILRKVKYGKWAFFALGLMPTIINSVAGIGYDATTIMVAFAFFALMMNLYTQNKRATKQQLILVVVLSILLVFTKQSNILLLLFLLFLPKVAWKDLWLFKKMRIFWHKIFGERKWLKISGIVFVGVGFLIAGYLFLVSKWHTAMAYFGGDKIAYVKSILSRAYYYFFREDLQPAGRNDSNYWTSSNGVLENILTPSIYMTTAILFIVIMVTMFIFIQSGLGAKNNKNFKRLGIVSGAVFLLIMFAIIFTFAIDPIFAKNVPNYIWGMHGRYFTPYIILLVPFLAYSCRNFINKVKPVSLALLSICSTVLLWFYLWHPRLW
jgi:uncharacterized membrane protein